MREHFNHTPPPKLHLGVPVAPQSMLINTELLAIDGAMVTRVAKSNGRIVVTLIDKDGGYLRMGDPDRKPGTIAVARELGRGEREVSFWITAFTADELLDAISSRIATWPDQVDTAPRDLVSSQAPLSVEQCASWELADIGETKTQYLFLRALDAPYALRIELTEASAARFVAMLKNATDGMTATERERVVEQLPVQVEVGKRPEQSTKVAASPPDPIAPPAAPPAAPASLTGRLLGLASKTVHGWLDKLGG